MSEIFEFSMMSKNPPKNVMSLCHYGTDNVSNKPRNYIGFSTKKFLSRMTHTAGDGGRVFKQKS